MKMYIVIILIIIIITNVVSVFTKLPCAAILLPMPISHHFHGCKSAPGTLGIYTTYNNNNNNNNKRGELVEQPVDFYEPYVLTATQPIVSNYPGKNGRKTVVAVVVVN